MKIENAFKVSAPVERVWAAMTDLEGLAPCMPGAQLTGVDGDDYKGKVRVKVGPVISQFAGTARFAEKDDTAHRAVVNARGKDTRGGGNASAVIELRLTPEADVTAVGVVTDLNITGKLAQFGSGMIKEISEKLLGQFVANLEQQLHTSGEATEPPPSSADTVAAPTGAAAGATATEAPAPSAPAAGTASPAQATPYTPPPAPQAVAPAAATTVPERTAGEASYGSDRSSGTSDTAADRPVRPARTSGTDEEPEALDLMSLAGSSVYKRLIPVVIVAAIVIAAIIYLIVR
ncbi:SRPBCC family protein [Streptomyces sp. 8L]|uniref:SRPBCC family protein n=1 Tax=Streptomyces sp. 8L TaxID=2877242 RepID=UPI001CD3D446|nr:SRPBCC family protein [Streptomyces sp. 8L]MCA1217745.1 SRPBCC family protein [Streptomyces sp. 8L]